MPLEKMEDFFFVPGLKEDSCHFLLFTVMKYGQA